MRRRRVGRRSGRRAARRTARRQGAYQSDYPYEQEVAPAQAYPSEPADDEEDYIDELERLAGLRDAGVITSEEFEAKKKQLLGL